MAAGKLQEVSLAIRIVFFTEFGSEAKVGRLARIVTSWAGNNRISSIQATSPSMALVAEAAQTGSVSTVTGTTIT